jgi:beta-N-acetylhexosaminidase
LRRFRPAAIAIFAFVLTLIVLIGLATVFRFSPLSIIKSPAPTGRSNSQTDTPTEQSDVTPTPEFTATSTPPPTATFTPTITPTATIYPEVEEILGEEDLSDHLGQLLMIGISGTEISSNTCSVIHQIKPGGIILTSGNALTPLQLRTFSAALQECGFEAGVAGGMIIAIDHEGQFVHRFDSGATWFPMPMAIGATGDNQIAKEVAQASGQELIFSGVNTVLGPIGDVITDPRNVVISLRSFGSDPEAVAEFAALVMRSYSDQGLIAAIKHFPGLGAIALDPHMELPVDQSSIDVIQSVHLSPFARAIGEGVPIVMVSHVDYPALDPSGAPSSMSGQVIEDLLKTEMDFGGIVLTDAIEMGAVVTGAGKTVDVASIEAINAGADMVMVVSSSNASFAYRSLREAFEGGEIAVERVEDALRRILSVKFQHGLNLPRPTAEVDWDANVILAGEAGRAAVTLEKNQNGHIPLPDEWERLLIVCPYWYPSIPTAIRSSGRIVDQVGYSVPLGGSVPEGATLRALPDRAGGYDAVVVCTYDAYLSQIRFQDTSQLEMVQGFLDSEVPTVVIALKSPYDLLGFPDAGTYLATFGTTPGQLEMVVEVLLGEAEATGVMPVDLGVD